MLYTMVYTADIPTHTEVATIAEDTALQALHEDPVKASEVVLSREIKWCFNLASRLENKGQLYQDGASDF